MNRSTTALVLTLTVLGFVAQAFAQEDLRNESRLTAEVICKSMASAELHNREANAALLEDLNSSLNKALKQKLKHYPNATVSAPTLSQSSIWEESRQSYNHVAKSSHLRTTICVTIQNQNESTVK